MPLALVEDLARSGVPHIHTHIYIYVYLTWDVYMKCLLILMRCLFDILIDFDDMYIVNLYYVFSHHVDVVVV